MSKKEKPIMVSINGNGNVNNNLFVNNGLQPQHVKGNENIEVKIADNKAIGEFGDKLLNQVMPGFVQTSKIPETDRKDLTEMFAMAGVKNPKMPTAAQYASISNSVGTVVPGLDKLNTTNHANDLFNSPQFGVLNDIFNIA